VVRICLREELHVDNTQYADRHTTCRKCRKGQFDGMAEEKMAVIHINITTGQEVQEFEMEV